MFNDNYLKGDLVFTPEQMLDNRGRIAIFIDGANLFYAALELNVEIDYTKLLGCLTAGSPVFRAFFYTGVDRNNDKQLSFLFWMRRNGYRVISKDLVQLPDGSKKANLDVEIAVDLVALVGSYDTAVLVSGDGDLAYAVNAASYRGARIEVVSLRSMTSDSLISVADRYIELGSLKEDIIKGPMKHPSEYTHSYPLFAKPHPPVTSTSPSASSSILNKG